MKDHSASTQPSTRLTREGIKPPCQAIKIVASRKGAKGKSSWSQGSSASRMPHARRIPPTAMRHGLSKPAEDGPAWAGTGVSADAFIQGLPRAEGIIAEIARKIKRDLQVKRFQPHSDFSRSEYARCRLCVKGELRTGC